MLAIKRKETERVALIHDGEVCWLTIVRIGAEVVLMGFDAPESFKVLREELVKVEGEAA
jgi:sRNA-binding carbon storage regulator CsrA